VPNRHLAPAYIRAGPVPSRHQAPAYIRAGPVPGEQAGFAYVVERGSAEAERRARRRVAHVKACAGRGAEETKA